MTEHETLAVKLSEEPLGMACTHITSAGPYDLGLSLDVGRSFVESPRRRSANAAVRPTLRVAVWNGERPTILRVMQVDRDPAVLEVSWDSPGGLTDLADKARRLVRADLDLRGFYRSVDGQSLLGRLTGRLWGLKPFRPSSLFEMAIIAIIEQQISLAAASRIRERLVAALGTPVNDLTAFPRAQDLAKATTEGLRACGLSARKADYVLGVSRLVAAGDLDMCGLESADDRQVVETITSVRGFGRWSAEYILVRGLGRVDVVPADDLGVRTVVGSVLGSGDRAGADEVRDLLEPFAPYRGLAVFYLLAAARLGLLE